MLSDRQQCSHNISEIMEIQQVVQQEATLFEKDSSQSTQPTVPTGIKQSEDIKSGLIHNPPIEHDQQSKQLIPSQTAKDDCCISYGKSVVLVRSRWLTLFIGPDYLCFIPTFIAFAIMSYFLITHIDRTVQHNWAKIITRIVCWGECLSYLLVALSDPGIAKPTKNDEKSGVRTMFCRRCGFNVPNKTYHCSYCDVCIEGYDHHCPWTSKCIGKNNLVRFYIFLFMTPVFIVYCAFAFGFSIQLDQTGPNLTSNSRSG